MQYRKQRTSGDRSPIVDGDFYQGWTLQDYLNAYFKEKRENAELKEELASQKVLRSRIVWSFSAVCGILLFFLASAVIDAVPRPAVSKETTPPVSQAAPAPSASLAANPRASSLHCAEGKWITVLGGWKPAGEKSHARDVFRILREVQARSQTKGAGLEINYTWLDEKQCSTLKKDLYIIWSGPHSDKEAAIKICHRLGWTTKADDEWCYARTIDPAYQGNGHVRPDEA